MIPFLRSGHNLQKIIVQIERWNILLFFYKPQDNDIFYSHLVTKNDELNAFSEMVAWKFLLLTVFLHAIELLNVWFINAFLFA